MSRLFVLPLAIVVVLRFTCIAVAADQDAADLTKAHQLLMRGRYAEAADLFRPIAAHPDTAHTEQAALGLASVLEETGAPAEAVKTLLPLAKNNATVQAELARMALDRGDLPEARSRADAAIALAQDHVQARYVQAELARATGNTDEAERGYRRLVDLYNNTEINRPEKLHCIGLAAAQYARWNHLNDQFDFLVNDLYPAIRKLDENYWPARYEAGLLFAEKYNSADAQREFQAALEINPRAAAVHVAMGRVAFEQHRTAVALRSLERALEIDPALVDAWLFKADLAWASLQTADALDILEHKARPLCPIREETLGRIAACYLLLDGLPDGSTNPQPTTPHSESQGSFARLLAEVQARNPHPAEFYDTLAGMMASRYRFAEAERYYRLAHATLPRYVGPLADLGLLMMRMGREDEAKKLLDEAFDADPFHVRVKNMLEVLDVLSSMQTLETEHFILKYDADLKRLADLAAPQLEIIYRELRTEFDYEPPGKTPVEIFSSCHGQDGHSWFSARVIGLPYLDTVAASTGRIVAMVSPEETQHGYNWHRVLKHEMVHVFNLQQSRFNIPHWFAEGVAVSNEGGRRPYAWSVLLHRRAAQGKLFKLADIDVGFTRAISGEDSQLAYCQGEMYVEYMKTLGGPAAIRKMLAAYTASPETSQAIRAVFGMSISEFEQGYSRFVDERLKAVPFLAEPESEELSPLENLCREQPGNASAAARLAYAYFQRNSPADAFRLARAALKLDPHEPLAAAVVAYMHKPSLKEEPDEDVVKLLDGALDRKAPHPMVLSLLAGLQVKRKKYDEAASLYALGRQFDSANPRWTAGLARVYLASGNTARLAETLAALADADLDDFAARKKLADLALTRRDYAAARRWAEEALEIKTGDAEVHRLLAAALVEQTQYTKAISEYQAAIELNPKQLQQRMALADACIQAGQIEQAEAALEELLKVDENVLGAKVLLKSLRENKDIKPTEFH
jgi:tetratricopeptide (TPR) repeat protein